MESKPFFCFVISESEVIIEAFHEVARRGVPKYGGSAACYEANTLDLMFLDELGPRFSGKQIRWPTKEGPFYAAKDLWAKILNCPKIFLSIVSVNQNAQDWIQESYMALLDQIGKTGGLPHSLHTSVYTTTSVDAAQYLPRLFRRHVPKWRMIVLSPDARRAIQGMQIPGAFFFFEGDTLKVLGSDWDRVAPMLEKRGLRESDTGPWVTIDEIKGPSPELTQGDEPPMTVTEAKEAFVKFARDKIPVSSEPSHYFICGSNPSVIRGFHEVFKVYTPAYGGSAEYYRGDVNRLRDRQTDAAASLSFAGWRSLGSTVDKMATVADVLSSLRIGADQGVFISHVTVGPNGRKWVDEVYTTLLAEAAKQGILPFHMYSTESRDAAQFLLDSFSLLSDS